MSKNLLPWLWYFVFRYSCPNRVRSLLFFKSPFKNFLNVIHAESTHCWTRDAAKLEKQLQELRLQWHQFQCKRQPKNYLWCKVAHLSPVKLCGEYTDNRGDSIDFYYVCDRLQNIEVEEWIPRNWAVEPSFQKGCPMFLQDSLGPSHVIFTYASHTGIHSLWREGKKKPKRKRDKGLRDARKTVPVSGLLMKHQR